MNISSSIECIYVMLKKYTFLFLSFSLAFVITSCHNDVGEVNPGTEQSNPITIPLQFGEVEGELFGYVFDNDNNPVAGAKVEIYSGETTTNEFGVFTFIDSKLDPQGTFVRVEKSGYLLGSDFVYPNSDGKGTARIKMLKVINESGFQASEGGTIQFINGGSITFSPSSLIRNNGSIYDGAVRSTAYRLSPIDPELGSQMSGGLVGIDKQGRHRVLSTYGILAVELRGFDNQKLKLKSDKVAQLSLPIDDEIQNFVEDVVPVWNFDFQDGLWHEYITTSNDGQQFSTSINTLGYWNIAIPSAVSQVCGRLIYTNELPAKNYTVQVINNGLPSRIGVTDQDGYFCGKVPLGENLNIQIMHPTCGEVLKEIIRGPFEDVGTIGDIVIEIEEKYLSGTIECTGELNSNSTIIVKSNNQTNVFYPNANGSFNINLEEIVCGTNSSFSIFAYDNSSEMASTTLDLTTNISESIKLEVCTSECLAERVFEYEKEDYCTDGEYSRVTIKVTNGSGEYTYEWQNGSTDEFINDPTSGNTICVNVVDEVTGCVYSFCDEVSSYERLNIESIRALNTECLITSGVIDLELVGGKQPLQYNWTGPNGYTSIEAQIEDLAPGTYTLMIQDGGNCEVQETVEVYDVTTPIQSSKEDFCDLSIITIEEIDGYMPYTYNWSAGNPQGNELYVYTPGVYNLTMTDANLCTRSLSLTISKAGSLPKINPEYNCDVGIVTFSDMQVGFDYYYQPFGTNDKIPVNMVQGNIEIAIIESGYRFEIGSENSNFSNCFIEESIELPRFDGLQIGDITSPTCEMCEDGHINFDIDVDENCQNCTPGDGIVIRSEDGVDVTESNELNQLENGEYYVVVLDGNTGCYIAHSPVVLEQ